MKHWLHYLTKLDVKQHKKYFVQNHCKELILIVEKLLRLWTV